MAANISVATKIGAGVSGCPSLANFNFKVLTTPCMKISLLWWFIYTRLHGAASQKTVNFLA
jgi:hypothetical protein